MCGIFGIITPRLKNFDRTAFCILGVNNDSRGGDSCGVFIDKKYEYGVDKDKLFYNFFPKSKLLNTTIKCQIALGHCRKASVGAINEKNAQPVVIKNDNGEVEYVLIHNGTIINYRELAAKYIPQVNIIDMTDSQVMAHIFYHTGYRVLGEYIGAGAFVMVDYRSKDPEVFLFKGESKNTQYSVVTTVERPLYCSYNSTEFIFSSIIDYLKALRPKREVMTLLPNNLIQLKEGKLEIVEEYNRKDLWQTGGYQSTYYTTPTTQVSSIRDKGEGSEDSFIYNAFNPSYWANTVEMDSNGLYFINERKAHGVFWVDALGSVSRKERRGAVRAAFWEGVLLKSSPCYGCLVNIAKEIGCSHKELLETLPDLVHFLSPCACWKNKGKWVVSDSPDSDTPYSGIALFPFTSEELTFEDGNLITYSGGVPYKEALDVLVKTSDYTISSEELLRLI